MAESIACSSPETFSAPKLRPIGTPTPEDFRASPEESPLVRGTIDAARELFAGYREGYGKQEISEDGTPLVWIEKYCIAGEDVYARYARTDPSELIAKAKLGDILKIVRPNGVDVSAATDRIAFEVFGTLAPHEKETALREFASSIGFEISGAVAPEKIGAVRDTLVLARNNARLRTLDLPADIRVRKDVAERLAIANRSLPPGWSLGVSNGWRLPETQRTIKDNHALFRGRAEADRLFASEDSSPHLTGGAVDIFLTKDGKRFQLALGNNSPETKTPFYEKPDADPREREILDARRMALHAMVGSGFVVNPAEYWHFSYGDPMWAYVTQRASGIRTVAPYGPIRSEQP